MCPPGYLVGDKAESYRGELTLTPVPGDKHRTLLTYEPTIVPMNRDVAAGLAAGIRADFEQNRIPFLKQVLAQPFNARLLLPLLPRPHIASLYSDASPLAPACHRNINAPAYPRGPSTEMTAFQACPL